MRLLLYAFSLNIGVFAQKFLYRNLHPVVKGETIFEPVSPELRGLEGSEKVNATRLECYSTGGHDFDGNPIKLSGPDDFDSLIELANSKNAMELYTLAPYCPIRYCLPGNPWQFRFCLRSDIEDLGNIKFFRADIVEAANVIKKSMLKELPRVGVCEWRSHPIRESDRVPFLAAKLTYQKDTTTPSQENPEFLPWEIQLVLGGCTVEQLEKDSLQFQLPVSDEPEKPSNSRKLVGSVGSMEPESVIGPTRTSMANSAGPISTSVELTSFDTAESTQSSTKETTALATPTESAEANVPLEDRGWDMRCYAEPYLRPFRQNNDVAGISILKEGIETGRLKATIDYRPYPDVDCGQHYCDSDLGLTLSLCGAASRTFKGELYLSELLEGVVTMLGTNKSCDSHDITSDPKFYRVTNLHWYQAKPKLDRMKLIGPEIIINQLDGNIDCSAFTRDFWFRFDVDPPRQNDLSPSSISSLVTTIDVTYPPEIPKTYVATKTGALLPKRSEPTSNNSANRPAYKNFHYYLEGFAKNGKGGNSLWLIEESNVTGGLDTESIIQLQKELFGGQENDTNGYSIPGNPDFIVEAPTGRDMFETDCTHYYCSMYADALISMCGRWWNGLPPLAANLNLKSTEPLYGILPFRHVVQSRWPTFFCGSVPVGTEDWNSVCNTTDYNQTYHTERSRPPSDGKGSYSLVRGVVREFSPLGGMVGPSVLRIEHLSLYGFNDCYDWSQAFYISMDDVGRKILSKGRWLGSAERARELARKTSQRLDGPPTATHTAMSATKLRLEPPPTAVSPDRPDPTDRVPTKVQKEEIEPP
ncbi:hypothetical protein TWF730_010988 [Orbilia blumenaviensis]|uniref:Uncharacterized protein n=1 Tax=Orbilia blumenaviensis TaxID=1796055 RepID=A0AAV9UJX7_9PEZI